MLVVMTAVGMVSNLVVASVVGMADESVDY